MVILDNLSVLSDIKNEHQSDEIKDEMDDSLSGSDGNVGFKDINKTLFKKLKVSQNRI